MSDLTDLLSHYGNEGDLTTADVLSRMPRPFSKGEALREAYRSWADYFANEMRHKAERPGVGSKDSDAAEFARTAILAPMAMRGGMGTSNGFGRALSSEPSTYYVQGGLGLLNEIPWLPRGFASQPREILGAGVAPPLSLIKHDATPMPDADAYWERARQEYPLRAQAQRIMNDFADKPGYHAWNSLRQIPMAMGYTGAAEGAAALAASRYLPLFFRAPEMPIPGSLLAERQGAR